MRTLRVYRHGITVSTPPGYAPHKRALRDTVQGWSSGATRRNVAFLRSVDETRLDAPDTVGLAFTLTVKDCPPTARDWHALRRAFIERLRRRGLVRLHWVTEWQRRGVPHLHGCLWVPSAGPHFTHTSLPMLADWLALAAPFWAGAKGQHIAPITDAVGWLQYLAKHAARGVSHYQRAAENIPPGWQQSTGRVWGHVGEWPLTPPGDIHLTDAEYFALRRMVRAWRVADARSRPAPRGRAIVSARRMLSHHDRTLCELRGVSEWIPEHQAVALYQLARVACAGNASGSEPTGAGLPALHKGGE